MNSIVKELESFCVLEKKGGLVLIQQRMVNRDPFEVGIFPCWEGLVLQGFQDFRVPFHMIEIWALFCVSSKMFPYIGICGDQVKPCWTRRLLHPIDHLHRLEFPRRLLEVPVRYPGEVVARVVAAFGPPFMPMQLTGPQAPPASLCDVSNLFAKIPLSIAPYSVVPSALANRPWSI